MILGDILQGVFGEKGIAGEVVDVLKSSGVIKDPPPTPVIPATPAIPLLAPSPALHGDTIRALAIAEGGPGSTFIASAGADGRLDTPDDILTTDDLYVENAATYHFQLQSRDVLHDFSVPVFRLKQDAVPGRTITGWFRPTVPGTYDIQCAEICGLGHGVMAGRIHVQAPAEYAAWVAEHSPASAQ